MTRKARGMHRLPYHLQHHKAGEGVHGHGRQAHGDLLRGVVVKVILPLSLDAIERTLLDRPYTSDNGIKCDVLIIEPEKRFILQDVPIAQSSAGVFDHEVWKPRATTLALNGEPLVVSPEGVPGLRATPAHDMDGDFVLVSFIDNDYNKPIIVGQIPHPRTTRAPKFTDIEKFKRQGFVRGISFGVTEAGNVEINLSLASSGEIIPGDPPTEPPTTPFSGNVTIVQAPLTKITIKDSLVPGPEPVILGRTFLIDMELTFATEQAAWGEVSTALAAFGFPVVGIAAHIAKLIGTRASIVVALGAGKPYLASHLETD